MQIRNFTKDISKNLTSHAMLLLLTAAFSSQGFAFATETCAWKVGTSGTPGTLSCPTFGNFAFAKTQTDLRCTPTILAKDMKFNCEAKTKAPPAIYCLVPAYPQDVMANCTFTRTAETENNISADITEDDFVSELE